MTDLPADLQLSRKALLLFDRANRMRILKDALGDAGANWIAAFVPKRFDRAYAMTELMYAASTKVDAYALSRDLPATYDERKQMLQGHDDPLVWTGALREQVFAQARVDTAAVRGTDDGVRAEITFGRLGVGRSGHYVALPDLVRRTLTGGANGLPATERDAITRDYQRNVVAQLEGIQEQVKQLPPAPAAVIDNRRSIAAQRELQLAGAQMSRSQISGFVHARKQALRETHEMWRQMSGGSAPTGGQFARSPDERRAAHRSYAKLSYWRRRDRILPRRRQRYAQLHSPHARAARAALGLHPS